MYDKTLVKEELFQRVGGGWGGGGGCNRRATPELGLRRARRAHQRSVKATAHVLILPSPTHACPQVVEQQSVKANAKDIDLYNFQPPEPLAPPGARARAPSCSRQREAPGLACVPPPLARVQQGRVRSA